ncbi:MAG: hypothetical protein J6D23_04240 [Clostridia bacterium]|nr:hypothetical protein [Clostridia bacterium]
MKKILTILLGIILVLSLFACKGDDENGESNLNNESPQSTTKYPWGDEGLTLPEVEL